MVEFDSAVPFLSKYEPAELTYTWSPFPRVTDVIPATFEDALAAVVLADPVAVLPAVVGIAVTTALGGAAAGVVGVAAFAVVSPPGVAAAEPGVDGVDAFAAFVAVAPGAAEGVVEVVVFAVATGVVVVVVLLVVAAPAEVALAPAGAVFVGAVDAEAVGAVLGVPVLPVGDVAGVALPATEGETVVPAVAALPGVLVAIGPEGLELGEAGMVAEAPPAAVVDVDLDARGIVALATGSPTGDLVFSRVAERPGGAAGIVAEKTFEPSPLGWSKEGAAAGPGGGDAKVRAIGCPLTDDDAGGIVAVNTLSCGMLPPGATGVLPGSPLIPMAREALGDGPNIGPPWRFSGDAGI